MEEWRRSQDYPDTRYLTRDKYVTPIRGKVETNLFKGIDNGKV